MHTDHAAYGIDLTSATRIYFMDPVWDISKEKQAIKRAHRIGQRQQVYVEKVLMQGTLEDLVLGGREDLASTPTKKHEAEGAKLSYLLRGIDYLAESQQREVTGSVIEIRPFGGTSFIPLKSSVGLPFVEEGAKLQGQDKGKAVIRVGEEKRVVRIREGEDAGPSRKKIRFEEESEE